MLALTSPVETRLHRLPAGAKLLALALTTALLLHLSHLVPLALAFTVVVAGHIAVGRAFAAHALAMLRPIWSFVAIVALWHIWTDDLTAGAVILLRMVTAVALANLVTMTTRLSDMVSVIERVLRPLRPLGLSPRMLALSIALVIRFIPVLFERMGRIREAWAARSPRPPGWRIMVPVTLCALDDADRVAEALRARGGAG